MNAFLAAVQQYDTYTENGAVSHSTSGSALVDYFAKCATYSKRAPLTVFGDISRIWSESPKITLQILFYMRMITRKTKGFAKSNKVQRGQGTRDEFRKGISWIARFHPDSLNPNLWLIPTVGTWKDLWHEDLIDDLNHKKVYELIQEGLNDPYHRDLLAKYLPRIRSTSQTYNERHKQLNAFAKGLCKKLEWTQKDYRQFKSTGKAHNFQRLMCSKRWNLLRWNQIPGRALFQMVSHTGKDGKTILERHNLEKNYIKWVEKQPVVKFTGYVHELFKAATTSKGSRDYGMKSLNRLQKMTYDKQFDGLIKLASLDGPKMEGNVWCALDTSGSMTGLPYEICISLGIFFSTLNRGAFADHVIMFDSRSRILKLAGTFTDKAMQIASTSIAWGSTNFQSVIDEIVRVRKQKPNIPVKDFPDTLLVISDMQFNPVNGNTETNYQRAMTKLKKVGLPKIKIVWWWVTGRKGDFPSTIEDEGVTMIGGFDGSILSLLLGGETTTVDKKTKKVRELNAFENMLKALDQEVLRKIKIKIS